MRVEKRRSPGYSLETMLRKTGDRGAYHEEMQIPSWQIYESCGIENFPVQTRDVVENFCINFTWCARRFSQKLRRRIRRSSPAAKSIVKLNINRRQSGDRDGQGFRSKMKRVIAGLKTRQNGFREPIKLARTRKLFRNPSSMLPTSVSPLVIVEILMEQ